jgi:hypothetical protein
MVHINHCVLHRSLAQGSCLFLGYGNPAKTQRGCQAFSRFILKLSSFLIRKSSFPALPIAKKNLSLKLTRPSSDNLNCSHYPL